MQTQKAIRYSVNTCPISDFTLGKAWRNIAALSLSLSLSFLCVKRSSIWYGFRAGAKAIRYSVNTYPIRDLTLEKAWPSIAALSLSLSLSFLCVKRSSIWYGFRAGAKAIRYSVNTYPIRDLTLEKAWPSIAALSLSLSLSFLCVKRSPIRYGFRAGTRAVRHSVNTYPICDFTLEKARRSIAALRKSR